MYVSFSLKVNQEYSYGDAYILQLYLSSALMRIPFAAISLKVNNIVKANMSLNMESKLYRKSKKIKKYFKFKFY